MGENENGAPAGARSFLLYNPPIIDETLGLRQSSILAAKDAAPSEYLAADAAIVDPTPTPWERLEIGPDGQSLERGRCRKTRQNTLFPPPPLASPRSAPG